MQIEDGGLPIPELKVIFEVYRIEFINGKDKFEAKEIKTGLVSDWKLTPWQAIAALALEIDENNKLEQQHQIELEKLAKWKANNA